MAASVTISAKDHAGARRIAEGTITLDSTYVNGTGEDVSAASLGLRTIEHISLTTEDGYVPRATQSADKSSINIRLFYGNYDSADGPLIEAASVDASTVVIPFIARGKA